ncbi:MAG: polysaccharide pyruvyl transferase family protein [Planctomycetota bacterium]|jgi:polysaccharide pyruvyl transferase WcaK-like protein
MKSPRILLIGIGGVYNYGCEAIVRGTERMLHKQWPDAKIVYASRRPEDDRVRLKGCNVEIIRRKHIGRYSPRNVVRKLLSISGISWYPATDPPMFAIGYSAVLSIGGDIYTIRSNGAGNRGFLRFGDACETRGVPYVLWGASVGPFSQNRETERIFTKHLKNISLITARETATVDYLQTLGVIDNVIPCADPAYVVASEIRTNDTNRRNGLTIGVNLSPLSVRHAGHPPEESIYRQARTIEGLIKAINARIVLIPHVVCDFMEVDDDLRYLLRLKQAIASEYQEAVTLLNNDIGFVGTKKELIKCDLVIAARMHCAINALAAHVPTILVAYSRKAVGMCQYVYGNCDWVIPLSEFSMEGVLEEKVRSMKNQESAIRDYLDKRIPEIQQDAYWPMQRLREVLEDGEPPRKCGFPN